MMRDPKPIPLAKILGELALLNGSTEPLRPMDAKSAWGMSLVARAWPHDHKYAVGMAYTEDDARATVCEETYEILSIRKLIACPTCGHVR